MTNTYHHNHHNTVAHGFHGKKFRKWLKRQMNKAGRRIKEGTAKFVRIMSRKQKAIYISKKNKRGMFYD